MLRARLKVIGGKHRGKSIAITMPKFLIGREQDCHLRPTSELVSRHHCAITVDEFTVRLRDLGSTNGTFVNDEAVTGQVTLKSGDRIRVGKLHFEMVITQLTEEEIRRLTGGGDATALTDILKEQAGADTSDLTGSETAHEIQVPLVVSEGDSSTDQSAEGDSGTFELNPVVGQGDSSVQSPIATGDSAVQEPETTVTTQQSLVPGDPNAQMQPQQPPPGFVQPGQYIPPAGGYPIMPGPPVQYPMPQMPYPQPPMPYQQPGVYAPNMYPMPQQPAMYPQAPVPAPAPIPEVVPDPFSEEDESANIPAPPVILPDPSQTGAKSKEPPAPKNEEEGADQSEEGEKDPSETAADIIRQHMQRPPGT